MNTRTRFLGVAGAAGLVLALALTAARAPGYPDAVVHVRVITVGQSALGPIDFWYDPRARLWRTVNASTSLNMYISCPAQSPCTAREAPAYRRTPLDGLTSWSALQHAFLIAPPRGVPAKRLQGTDGHTVLYYDQGVTGAGAVRRQYWVEARTGWVIEYRELIAGFPTTDERLSRAVLAPGTLPRGFFAPPPAANWLGRLADWLGARLPHQGG